MAYKKGALTDEFRKRRRGLILGEALPLHLEYIHPYSGARLVFAKIDSKPRPIQGPYIVGWVAPGEEAVWFYRNFETQQASRAFFRQQKDMGPPDHNDFKNDGQVNNVYTFEKNIHQSSKKLTVPQMKKIVSDLSVIFNMTAPDVIYRPKPKSKTYAEADFEKNEIKMHRSNLTILLHEFSHLANNQINKDKWIWHGPAFVRTYLSILSLFPEIAANQDLEARAMKTLKIANQSDVPACRVLQEWKTRQGLGAPRIIISDI